MPNTTSKLIGFIVKGCLVHTSYFHSIPYWRRRPRSGQQVVVVMLLPDDINVYMNLFDICTVKLVWILWKGCSSFLYNFDERNPGSIVVVFTFTFSDKKNYNSSFSVTVCFTLYSLESTSRMCNRCFHKGTFLFSEWPSSVLLPLTSPFHPIFH